MRCVLSGLPRQSPGSCINMDVLRTAWSLAIALVCVAAAPCYTKEGFTEAFTPAEFRARREIVMEQIGEGVAVIHGSSEWSGFRTFRQNAQFFYLTGVEVPRALLIIDGKARAATLFLPAAPPPRNSRYAVDPFTLYADDSTKQLTGIENVRDREAVMGVLTDLAKQHRQFYAPFRSESRTSGAPELSRNFDRANATDPLDGRLSREAMLVTRLNTLAGAPTLDLDPIVDRLRLIKSPAEIAAMREAARISQLAIMEVMRSARPGVYEYQLAAAAEYEFRYHHAAGAGYFPVIGTGTNAYYGHYHYGQSQLGPSELVLIDYGPDYQNYLADLTRMFPSNGKFTRRQREMYVAYLHLYKALEASVKPGLTPRVILQNAAASMRRILDESRIADPKIKAATEEFVARLPVAAFPGHGIGLEIHDPATPYGDRDDLALDRVLEPGMVLTIEPIMTIPDEKIFLRLEDELLVTDHGCESLSTLAPIEPESIERLMQERGIAERHDAGR